MNGAVVCPAVGSAVVVRLAVDLDGPGFGVRVTGVVAEQRRADVARDCLDLVAERAHLRLELLDRPLDVVDPLERDPPDEVVAGLVLVEFDDPVVLEVGDPFVLDGPLDGPLLGVLVDDDRLSEVRVCHTVGWSGTRVGLLAPLRNPQAPARPCTANGRPGAVRTACG